MVIIILHNYLIYFVVSGKFYSIPILFVQGAAAHSSSPQFLLPQRTRWLEKGMLCCSILPQSDLYLSENIMTFLKSLLMLPSLI